MRRTGSRSWAIAVGSLAAVSVSGIQWGTVSDWVSGVATVVAVIVALTFSLRSEREQRNARLASVYAWVEVSQGIDRSGTLWLTNNAEYPIYDWHATVSWADGQGAAKQAGTGSAEYGLLPPGRHSFTFADARSELPRNDAAVSVQLEFRDAQGRRLRRLSTGKLETL